MISLNWVGFKVKFDRNVFKFNIFYILWYFNFCNIYYCFGVDHIQWEENGVKPEKHFTFNQGGEGPVQTETDEDAGGKSDPENIEKFTETTHLMKE